VDEQQQVIGELERAGVLAGLRWAYRSATTRTLETYSEADGHDAAWLGNTRFTLFRDRLDRVFGCGRYALPPGSAATANIDVLYAELSEHDRQSMPSLAPGLVRRADLTGSPGWARQRQRFLLASCPFGQVDRLPWPQQSPTKQRVARQLTPEPPQPSLFDEVADEELAGLLALMRQARTLDLETFVVAHALDPVSDRIELVFGRPRLNSGGGYAWYWRQDLLGVAAADGRRRLGSSPVPDGPDAVPDAPVRLRRPATDARASDARASDVPGAWAGGGQ
jgi:hypothetical protein